MARLTYHEMERLAADKCWQLRALQGDYFRLTGQRCLDTTIFIDCRLMTEFAGHVLRFVVVDLLIIVVGLILDNQVRWFTIMEGALVALLLFCLIWRVGSDWWDAHKYNPGTVRCFYWPSQRLIRDLSSEIQHMEKLLGQIDTD